MEINFDREKLWWNAKVHKEEMDKDDEFVNRALRWREIERHLDGIETILEIGGATGQFSIPLAKMGKKVTHVDFSPKMINTAKRKCNGLENIEFVEGNATNLSQFDDQSYDMVLNMDGAISFCGSEADKAIFEAVRIARKKVVLTVSHRARMIPTWISGSIKASQSFLPFVHKMVQEGKWHQEEFPENKKLTRGLTQDYLGAMKTYLPAELHEILKNQNMKVLRCGGLGSLSGFVHRDVLDEIRHNESLMEEFLDLCEKYDSEILPDGPGTRQRAGLIAVAERI